MFDYTKYEGQTFGDIKVLKFDHNEGNGKIFYKCKCLKCGMELPLRIDNVKKYGSTSKCYCQIDKQIQIGTVYKDLEVLALDHNDHGKKYYRCKCIRCGRDDLIMRADSIKTYGHSSKCDCVVSKPNPIEDLTGRKFNFLLVEEFAGKDSRNESMWKCLCTKCNKNHPIVRRGNLISGNSRMCNECSRKQAGENRLEDLTGKRFGNIVILERDTDYEKTKDYRVTYWKYQCDCGNISSSPATSFKGENPITCCPECRVPASYRHGMSNTNFYKIWSSMKARCYNKNSTEYNNYGGRGITVCEEWREDFVNFYNDMYQGYVNHVNQYGQNNTSIDRINNDGNYCKENCRWATNFEQANNKSTNIKYDFRGNYYTVPEIIEKGFTDPNRGYNTISTALQRGKPINEAVLNIAERKNLKKPISFINRNNIQ